ncbi:hypothetical protein C2E25_12910 [Geothermobacter hydrogeniphilus]|uniref:Uncharacterized protein n=1 Tax=Geothermobacter hydrogeniphilus TaxID=1969733 RepID=A0A1X0XMV9_9BACT|nr:hypothetical protein [Geothermobacter hydrogeniphilus]ORJ54249.1 hypothetical protein B5V00_15895 [Geothermobacter hydrogeniphilus]PNU19383.1 hypothetical protein C2E25_12910 [Geothermobacter hydrogeniphilus]
MSISTRYRDLAAEAADLNARLKQEAAEEGDRCVRQLAKAVAALEELREGVGEIPQMRLERELTPVLLRAHNDIDRARLWLEEEDRGDWSARLWGLQQTIYRLLNDL